MSKYKKAKQSPALKKKYRDYSSDEDEADLLDDVNLIGNISDSSNLHSRSQNVVRVDLEAAKYSPRRGGTDGGGGKKSASANKNPNSSAYAVNQITTNVFAPLANGP